MSVDQHRSPITSGGVEEAACVPTASDAVASALGSVRAEGLEPDADGLALLHAVASGAMTTGEAVERALALYAV